MATRQTAKKPASKSTPKQSTQAGTRLDYPKNVGVPGILSFPLWSEQDLPLLSEWRAKRGLRPGKFPDRIGGTLFITQEVVNKVQSYLLDVFLPFTEVLYGHSNGQKGFDAEDRAALADKIGDEDWDLKDYTLPIRDLSTKDRENLTDDSIVAKFVFNGSGGNAISKKALVRDEDGALVATSLDMLTDEGIAHGDEHSLWWGSRNMFRGAFNLNPYTAATTGITAYTRALYLRADLPMQWGGGNDDDTVLEDDFE